MIAGAGNSWQAYAEKLECDRSAFEKAEYKAFCAKAREAFVEKAVAYIVDMLEAPEGAVQLLRVGAPKIAQRLLVDISSQLWSGPADAAPAEETLKDAGRKVEVQKNASAMLAASGAEMQALLRHERAAVALWNALIAQPLQFRMLRETRFARKRLILGGVSEAALAFPEWLRLGEENDEEGQ